VLPDEPEAARADPVEVTADPVKVLPDEPEAATVDPVEVLTVEGSVEPPTELLLIDELEADEGSKLVEARMADSVEVLRTDWVEEVRVDLVEDDFDAVLLVDLL
jgi:hypothetical protein